VSLYAKSEYYLSSLKIYVYNYDSLGYLTSLFDNIYSPLSAPSVALTPLTIYIFLYYPKRNGGRLFTPFTIPLEIILSSRFIPFNIDGPGRAYNALKNVRDFLRFTRRLEYVFDLA